MPIRHVTERAVRGVRALWAEAKRCWGDLKTQRNPLTDPSQSGERQPFWQAAQLRALSPSRWRGISPCVPYF
jgi:hypothetical protein